MFRKEVSEYIKGKIAVRTVRIIFFDILVYEYTETTTNQNIVSQLASYPKSNKKIKGFLNETDN